MIMLQEILLHLAPAAFPFLLFAVFLQNRKLHIIVIFFIIFFLWSFLDSTLNHKLTKLPLNTTKLSHLLPFLEEYHISASPDWCTHEVDVIKEHQVYDSDGLDRKLGYALVTGASKGKFFEMD